MAYKSVFDASAIKSEFQSAGVNPNFVPLVWKHVLQNPHCRWDEIPSLPSAAYTLLNSKFKPCTSTLHSAENSSDGVTTKLLIKLQNEEFVEAVIMRYDTRLGKYDGKPRPGGPRSTLCISSQVGCKMGCKFCATGSMGFKSNLSSGEILEQLVHASRISAIRNVVFMVAEAIASVRFLLILQRSKNILLFVTDVTAVVVMNLDCWLLLMIICCDRVGVIHAISKLQRDVPNLNLAVSLHAPVQDIRCQIMPAARAFPLERLMNTLREYQTSSQQKIFIEYIMLDGVNDEEQHAHLLGKLLETYQVVVNLIPFNPIGSLSSYKTSSDEKVTIFQRTLRGTYNIRTTVRKQMGQDISGACGQLVVNKLDKRSLSSADHLTDIEDLHI
ncbi:UNVERIFIED_CONTAM: Dual-specificity RNA methyltransferase RlmN [Sesamum angustifolium]|uniref:Dual-specificity RNA methyltransferase RlmN n=1 Tax=Sesamum angustifolium TaxID=2727405 RepID=A0AAW2QCH0_9LAMI